MNKLLVVLCVLALLLSAGCTKAASTPPPTQPAVPTATPTQTLFPTQTARVEVLVITATPAVSTSLPTEEVEEPDPIVRATVTPAAPTSAPVSGEEVAACPSDGEMWQLIGLPDNVRPVFHGESVSWDPCQWQWQAYSTSVSITLPLPVDWQATVTLKDGTVAVYRGESGLEVQDVAGFNLRYVLAYPANHWVWDDCALWAQEAAFGQRRNPSYGTVSGNLSCSDMTEFDTSVCPSTTAQVAALVGGNPEQWTAPDWELGAWVFKAPAGQFVKLTVPSTLQGAAEVVRLDYWNGGTNAAASFGPGEGGLALNEAAFHCHAAE